MKKQHFKVGAVDWTGGHAEAEPHCISHFEIHPPPAPVYHIGCKVFLQSQCLFFMKASEKVRG